MLRPICEIAHFTKWASASIFREMGNTLAYFVNWALENVPISRIGQML